MDEKLETCPFCGNDSARSITHETYQQNKYTHIIECAICGCKTIECYDYDLVKERWNTRANTPNKHEQALLDVLRQKLVDAVDENTHPEDQRGILRDTLKDLIAPELFDAYEGALEGFVCADRYNARVK